jgi:hypothetical protein
MARAVFNQGNASEQFGREMHSATSWAPTWAVLKYVAMTDLIVASHFVIYTVRS